jgi:hypothetical protein
VGCTPAPHICQKSDERLALHTKKQRKGLAFPKEKNNNKVPVPYLGQKKKKKKKGQNASLPLSRVFLTKTIIYGDLTVQTQIRIR